MIRVLHLRDTDKVCGPGKTILETASRIDRSQYEIAIGLLMLESETHNHYRDAAEARGIEVIPLCTKSQFSPKILSIISNVVRHRGFDIVHSHEYKSDILAYLIGQRCGVPIVTTAHGWITNSLKGKLYIWLGKKVLRFFDKVIAVSPAIRSEILRHGVNSDKVDLIFNAIVVENYQPHNFSPGYLRSRFNLSDSATIIGNIGRLSPEKGQINFLRSARKLLEYNRGLYFVLVGDGPDRDRLENYVDAHGIRAKVFFTGHEQDVRPIYRDIDLLALTSYTEGFPNVVMEALCMGIPVLATDVGGVSSIIDDRETGILASAHDVESITSGLKWILDHPKEAKAMVAKGQLRIDDQFTFERRIDRVKCLYNEVLRLKALNLN